MADIFGKNITTAPGPLGRAETFEVYAVEQQGDNATTAPGPGNGTFIGLAQGVQNSYNQPLQRVLELGSFRTYMVSGRPVGSLSITRLVGNATDNATSSAPTLMSLLPQSFREVDGSRGGIIKLRERTTGAVWICNGCYVTQESTGVDANGILVSEQIAIEYQFLQMSGVVGTSPPTAEVDPNPNRNPPVQTV